MSVPSRRLASVAVVGQGRLGGTLTRALSARGHPVASLARHDPVAEICWAADWVFLAVPDREIARVAEVLQWRPGQAAIHCAGALGLEVLEPARRAGAWPGGFHPLAAFPTRSEPASRFAGIAIGIEADEPLGGALEALARELGARPVRLEGVDRRAYHAACVLASNAAIGLLGAARAVWTRAGLPAADARTALAALMTGAAHAATREELAEALTGPIARGDVATVAGHLDALAGDPARRSLYVALSREMLALDLELEDAARHALLGLLERA